MSDLQGNVYAGISITWGGALIALILRVLARRMTKQAWWFDDYFCVSAFLFASAYNSVIIVWTKQWHLGRIFDEDISPDDRENILTYGRLLMLMCEYCYTSSIASSKFTILFLYWRLFKHSKIRLPIQIMLAVTILWTLLRIFMVSLQCIPLTFFWDKTVDGHCGIDSSNFFFGTVLTHFVMDVVILVLPMIEVGNLRLRLGQKLAVIGLFLIGALVCLASVFVLVESITYDEKTSQMPHDTALNFAWGGVEINIAIVSACVPLLRPIIAIILPTSFLSSYGSSHPISYATHSRPIKLTSIRTQKDKEADDSSSIHKLAVGQKPLQTIVSSHPRSSRSYSSGGEQDLTEIRVRNELVIEVEELTPDLQRIRRN
ncbi:hypothetical protein FSARC_10948 [Fusarium sarcochroum]|uniref:Rhodopsin domain-containing protein n=1 Tax=Fusarium sarcochroum TaxID=1208366 RepID=A0A8H4TIN7_9HYPO|nr:hypothetical protein FSARC_10948 [Fusarium sarcochroum]